MVPLAVNLTGLKVILKGLLFQPLLLIWGVGGLGRKHHSVCRPIWVYTDRPPGRPWPCFNRIRCSPRSPSLINPTGRKGHLDALLPSSYADLS